MADIYLVQGDDEEITVTIADADGSPIDLSGYTVAAQLRDTSGNLLCTPAVTTADAAAGQISIRFSSADTAALAAGVARLDIKLVDAAGQVHHVPHPPDQPWLVQIAAPVTRDE